jgi:serine/threonine-protein kinase
MSDRVQQLNQALEGRYTVQRELGRGGMATVWLASDLRHSRPVAIKVLHPELGASLGPERFLREIEIAAGLSHPHILPVFDSGSNNNLLWYVMPYVEGESLRDRLDRGKVPVDELIRITDQVAAALSYAHQRGIVHRDIKPENILLTADQAVVADFGIARAVEAAGGARLTGTGLALGTPAYMSPEQATGSGAVDARADIYSLGCVVWEMAAGRPPYQGTTPQALIANHVFGAPPNLRTTDPSLPLYLQRALERAMAKDPKDRFASASEFAAALTTGTVVARASRRRWRQQLAGGAIVAAVALLLWWGTTLGTTGTVHALAVLPLTNLSGDTTQAYFVDGVHEALIGELASTGLRVIARSSVMRYRSDSTPAGEIARQLGVDALVEGSVFRSGDSIEIQARLIDPATATATWSGRFDGNLPNVVALYRGLTRAVASEIRFTLRPDVEARLAQSDQLDVELYETYLKGMYHLNRLTPEDIQQALDYFNAAVTRNPASALAWAGLAAAYVTLGHGPDSPADAWIRARAAAERAVRLDSTLAEAWGVLADVRTYALYDWDGAEMAFQRANALNPSQPLNHYHYAWYLALFGRFDEAVEEHELSRDLDPFTPLLTAWQATMYAAVGRHDDALAESDKALALGPAPVSLLARIGVHTWADRPDSAVATAERLAAMSPVFRGPLGAAYAGAGRRAEALAIAAELEQAPIAWHTLYLGIIHRQLGNVDQAVRWLSIEPFHAFLPWLVVGLNRQDEYLNHPGFQQLAARLNLTGRLGWQRGW